MFVPYTDIDLILEFTGKLSVNVRSFFVNLHAHA
jgi:hypothetical protein